jgi:hypothetical protein
MRSQMFSVKLWGPSITQVYTWSWYDATHSAAGRRVWAVMPCHQPTVIFMY